MSATPNTSFSARDRLLLSIILLASLLVASCTGNLATKGRNLIEKGKYVEAIDIYKGELSKNPNRKDTWRDLALAYYKKGEFAGATEAIDKANQADPLTYLCRGLIFEGQGNNEQAISAFADALKYNPTKNTRILINSHLDGLIRSSLKMELDHAVAAESTIVVSEIPQNTIAVVKFDGSLLPPETAPIAAGIAEFTTVDLGKVEKLRLVERIKVQLLLNELALGTTQNVDVAQAPRMGRLLGSRNVVTGKLTGAGVEKFRLDGALVNTVDASSQLTEPGEAGLQLDQILQIQKGMVFDILKYLGVDPTPADRDSIMVKPTESLEAFLAYSRGLDFMARGMYEEAVKQFELALRYDNHFGLASNQLGYAQTALFNREYGVATSPQLENSFFQDAYDANFRNGQMLSSFIDGTDVLEPGNHDPSSAPNKPPQVGRRHASAAVTGNLDGDK